MAVGCDRAHARGWAGDFCAPSLWERSEAVIFAIFAIRGSNSAMRNPNVMTTNQFIKFTKGWSKMVASFSDRRVKQYVGPFIVVLSVLTLIALHETRNWRLVENIGFDYLSRVMYYDLPDRRGQELINIILIEIDDNSLEDERYGRWPWSRERHAELVRYLSDKGAAVIAFDVMFHYKDPCEKDSSFANAIQEAENVVLAVTSSGEEGGRQWKYPISSIMGKKTEIGNVRMELDPDGVPRHFPKRARSRSNEKIYDFSFRVLQSYFEKTGNYGGSDLGGGYNKNGLGDERSLIRYVSLNDLVKRYPYNEFDSIPGEEVSGAIVLIGRVTKDAADIEGGLPPDHYRSPVSLLTGEDISGVELRAMLLVNSLYDLSVREIPVEFQWVLIMAVMVASLWVGRVAGGSSPRMFAVFISLLIFWFVLSVFLFEHLRLWLPVIMLMIIPLPIFVGFIVKSQYRERKRSLDLRQKVKQFLHEKVVSHVFSVSPGELEDEEKTVTVLFMDLPGFTHYSTDSSLEGVCNRLDDIYELLVKPIDDHRGTVDKYIGDAIMAYWEQDKTGATSHAREGLMAAVEMLSLVRQRNESIPEDEPHKKIDLRIGVHTGSVRMGVRGSSVFSGYTIIGDAVNLAARLESANKQFKTQLLVSRDTVDLAGVDLSLRKMGRIRVVGRESSNFIYSISSDPEWREGALLELSNRGVDKCSMESQGEIDWDEVRKIWREVSKKKKGDRLASMYLDMIGDKEGAGEPRDWSGVIELESK